MQWKIVRKRFSVFVNILKILFSYNFFTFSQPFSQLPNKFYIRKSTTTHTLAPIVNPPPHNTKTTKTPLPTPPQQQQQQNKKQKKSEIKERKIERLREREIGLQGWRRSLAVATRSRGDDLTQRRTRRSRGRWLRSDSIQKSKPKSKVRS